MSERFFGKNDKDDNKELENLKQDFSVAEKEAVDKLAKLDLSVESIESMSPDQIDALDKEIRQINDKVLALKKKIPRTLDDELAKIKSAPEELNKLDSQELIKEYLILLKMRERDFLIRLIDDSITHSIMVDKLKTHDKVHHWKEIMHGLSQGVTSQLNIDYYKGKGIDIVNPTEQDAEKYFSGVEYQSPGFAHEIYRRRHDDFADLDETRKYSIEQLLWKLECVPDNSLSGFHTMTGTDLVEMLSKLKDEISRM